jgi:hypothetical protein
VACCNVFVPFLVGDHLEACFALAAVSRLPHHHKDALKRQSAALRDLFGSRLANGFGMLVVTARNKARQGFQNASSSIIQVSLAPQSGHVAADTIGAYDLTPSAAAEELNLLGIADKRRSVGFEGHFRARFYWVFEGAKYARRW